MLKISSFVPFLKSSLTYLIGLAVFVVVLGVLYIADTTYRIRNVEVVGKTNIPIAGIPSLKNKYMFLTREDEIADTISRTNPSVKTVVVTKQYPDTIKLSILRYEPEAYLKSADGYFILAQEGIILSKSIELGKTKLPLITYYQSIPFFQYQAGSQLPAQDIRDGIYFSSKLREMGIKINSIDIAGFHMLGLYTEDKKYFFSSEKERKIQLYHFEQAITRFKTEGQEYKTIDVRFAKPVITF